MLYLDLWLITGFLIAEGMYRRAGARGLLAEIPKHDAGAFALIIAVWPLALCLIAQAVLRGKSATGQTISRDNRP